MGSWGTPIRLDLPEPQIEAQAAWKGVRDIDEGLATHGKEVAFVMENVYPQDAVADAGIVSRPGFLRMNSGAIASSSEVQCIGHITKRDQTEITYAVVAGQVYTYNWGTDTWSVSVTTANLTTASVALPSTGQVYATAFNDEVVINPNDGTNRPFSWDGTSGAGGVTALTNCPLAYGKPEVFYAKLFVIGWSVRNEIYWSEENQPNTGYDAGGFNNAWQLGQTESEAINVLMPTNEALYYARTSSIGAITGRVTPQFQTTGVHEAVSKAIGSKSPRGWVAVRDHIYFVDQLRRVQVIEIHGGHLVQPEPWRLARGVRDDIPAGYEERIHAVYSCDMELVMFAVPDGNDDQVSTMNFCAATGVFCGEFTGFVASSVMDTAKDSSGCERIIYGTGDGFGFYGQLTGEANFRDQTTAGADQAIDCVFESAPFFYDVKESRLIDRLELLLLSWGFTSLNLSLVTERGEFPTNIAFSAPAPGSAVWDTAVWDTDTWAGQADGFETRVVVGTDQYCRWARVRLSHSEINGRWGVAALMVEAYPQAAEVRWP